jgi:hypothetical protein
VGGKSRRSYERYGKKDARLGRSEKFLVSQTGQFSLWRVGYNLTAKGCDMRIYIQKICPDFSKQRDFAPKCAKSSVISVKIKAAKTDTIVSIFAASMA